MNAVDFAELLSNLDACAEAREWASGKTLAQAWKTCPRGNWMLWLCGRMEGEPGWPTRQAIVLAACACAETALKYVPLGEDRPSKCLEIVRLWAEGKATIEDVKKVRRAATDAAATYAATYAVTYAANAATYAANAATYAANATYAVTYAANAATYAADAAAAATYATYADAATSYAARKRARAKCADIVRKQLSVPGEIDANPEETAKEVRKARRRREALRPAYRRRSAEGR